MFIGVIRRRQNAEQDWIYDYPSTMTSTRREMEDWAIVRISSSAELMASTCYYAVFCLETEGFPALDEMADDQWIRADSVGVVLKAASMGMGIAEVGRRAAAELFEHRIVARMRWQQVLSILDNEDTISRKELYPALLSLVRDGLLSENDVRPKPKAVSTEPTPPQEE